jgi:TolB-like protein/Tfp pilus assembly protein PilF
MPGPERQTDALGLATLAPAVPVLPARVAASPLSRSRLAIALAVVALGVGAVSFLPAKGTGEPYSIAVLPFSAVGPVDPALADGLSEELLSQLALDPSLKVTGRTSSWQYKNRAADLRKVGRELGVDYLVEGTVRLQGPGLRVTAALIKVDDASALWSRSFSGSQEQAEPIQAAIGQGVIDALGLGAQVPRAKSTRGEAYLLYIRAKGLMRQRTGQSLASARELLIEAVRLDPSFAAAWAQLGGAIQLKGEREFSLDASRPDGPRMTTQAAIRRALALDPQLAEGHAMMALVLGFETDEGRYHLRKALELEPRNPQTLYWWSAALSMSGESTRAAEVTRQAAAIDPLWQRPVEIAARNSLWAGDRETAERYLEVIRAGNPVGAVDVESTLALAEGDFSRAIGRAFAERSMDWSGAMVGGYQALISLGFVSEGLLVKRLDGASEAIARRRAPDRASLLRAAHDPTYFGEEGQFYSSALWELGRVGRFADIAALYDARQGPMRNVHQRTKGNRQLRVGVGGRVALALAMVGRKREAVHLLVLADEAGKTYLANGQVPPLILVEIAANDAVLGRRDRAIAELQAAVANGWRAYEEINGEIGEDAMFATLRGDPRFERLRRQLAAWRARERRETAALGIF